MRLQRGAVLRYENPMNLLLLAALLFTRPHGFTVRKICSWHSHDPIFEAAGDSSPLSGTFTYLGSGNHSYNFLSEDGLYVLKFFKQQHMRAETSLDMIPLPTALIPGLEEKRQKHLLEREESYGSYKVAFEKLSDITGVVYLHLTRTNHLHQTIHLVDQNGISHKLNADRMEFLIQKYASLGFSRIEKLIKEGEEARALKTLVSWLPIVAKRAERGYFDKDLQLFKNFGFADDQPMQIDIGEYRPDDSQKDPAVYRKQLEYVAGQIRTWVRNNHNHLMGDLEVLISETMTKL